MPRYIVFTRSIRGTNHILDGELKEARAVAQYEANMSRQPVAYGAIEKPVHIAFPEHPTFAEFLGAARRAVLVLREGGDGIHELWLRHMYTGERSVYGALGYMAHR